MTQEIKDKLVELNFAANDICSELWEMSEDESLTEEERDLIGGYVLDADQLALNITQL